MSDDSKSNSDIPVELQPIVTRLQEIHRKCIAMGPRNDEAQEMAARLEKINAEISRVPGADEPPVPFRQLAGQLFPVARLFESLGFISIAKEIAHVEKSLIALDPGGDLDHSSIADPATTARKAEAQKDDDGPDDEKMDDGPGFERRERGLPKPVALALLLVLIAALVAIFLVRLQRSSYQASIAASAATPTPATEPTEEAPPALIPTPEPTVRETPTPGPRARLATLIGQSRLAFRRGDMDAAISLLSQAALIDNTSTSVIETARTLVSGLIARGDAAADEAQWETATQYLDRARELAVRFELSTQPINDAGHRHRRLVRYIKLDPGDTADIRANSGKKIVVIDLDGERFEGRIHDVTGSVLEIHEGMQVGRGGTLFHVDEIPLARIREIRVYPD